MIRSFTLRCRDRLLNLDATKIMGVINVNTDSFYSGSRLVEIDAILRRAEKMKNDGAEIIDLGVMSSRPGAEMLTSLQEIEVLEPIVDKILKEVDIVLSIDTWHSSTARTVLEIGAHMINDISGGVHDVDMMKTVLSFNAAYILMHMRGNPKTMTSLTNYSQGVTLGVLNELKEQLNQAQNVGLHDVVVDPGFGFSKTIDQNFELLQYLSTFHILERPLMVGVSRKSMIWRVLNITPEEALNGTTVAHTLALIHNPHILRVHDVKAAMDAITLQNYFNKSKKVIITS